MPEFLDLHSRTSKLLRALVERTVRPYGLYPGQDLVLGVLWAGDGRTPGEVATALHVTTPTIVKTANRMTETGLLERRRDTSDSRLVRLWLTEKGRDLQEAIEHDRAALESLITADLTDTERRNLLTALDKISRSASRLLEQPPQP